MTRHVRCEKNWKLRGGLVALVFVGLLAGALSGCLQSPTVACGNDTFCSAGTRCLEVGPDILCVSPQQEKDCLDKGEGEVCGENTGMANRCRGGLCLPSPCGDGRLDSSRGEVCEASDVSQLQSCEQRGYQGGDVGCSASCGGADTETCSGYCGDGVVDDDEECDGVAFAEGLPSKCNELAFRNTLVGTVSCSSTCRIDSRSCVDLGWSTGAIITTPALPAGDIARGISAVDNNNVWVVFGNEIRARGDAVVWWNGDRWQRATIDGQDFTTSQCPALWATVNRAWVGCDDGTVINFDELGHGIAAPLNPNAPAAVKAMWGSSASDVWASQGADVYHYDGVAWQFAGTPSSNATVLAIGGDADDVFVLTSVGLSKRQGTAWVTVVNGAFDFLSVVDDRQIWLANSTSTVATAYFYNGSTLPPPMVLPPTTTLVAPVISIAALSADTLFYNGGQQIVRAPAVRRLQINSISKRDEVEVGLTGDSAALSISQSGSVWTMIGVRFATQTRQLNALAIDAPLTSLAEPLRIVMTATPDGIVYFTDPPSTPGDTALYSYDQTSIGAVTFLANVAGVILDAATVTGPNGERLLVQTADQLLVYNSSAAPSLRTVPFAPQALWSDGTAAFVTSAQGLHRFVDAATWPLVPVTLPVAAVPHLLTGGRINQDYTLWRVPRQLSFTDANANKIQRIDIDSAMQGVVTDIVVPSGPREISVSAVWGSSADLWIAGQRKDLDNPGSVYLARWTGSRWLEFSPPLGFGTEQINFLSHIWSNRPGQVWALGNVRATFSQLLRFDGSRWFVMSEGGARNLTTLSRNAGDQLWANVPSTTDFGNTLARVDNPIQNLTGGRCPAQQELICVENGHNSSAPERNITTIVGGRFGASHYVLNSPILGKLRLTAALPAGIEAVWGLANAAGTCSSGATLPFVAPASTPTTPNPVPRSEVTLGRARYFLTLQPSNPLDTKEYAVSADYSCNRSD